MTLHVQDDLFAEAVGFFIDQDIVLFKVSRPVMTEEWSEPVQFRFVLTPGAYPSMEMRRVEPNEETIAA